MSKSILLISAALLIAIAPACPAATAPQEPAGPATNPGKVTPESQEKAKKLYKIDCELCHGATGNGKTDIANDMHLTIADWTNPKALANKSDKELFDIIRKGKDKMPAEEEGRATSDAVWNLIQYIRNFSKDQPAAAPTQ